MGSKAEPEPSLTPAEKELKDQLIEYLKKLQICDKSPRTEPKDAQWKNVSDISFSIDPKKKECKIGRYWYTNTFWFDGIEKKFEKTEGPKVTHDYWEIRTDGTTVFTKPQYLRTIPGIPEEE